MTKHRTWMLALSGLLASGCAGDLVNPERFEKDYNGGNPADGGATGSDTAGNDGDAAPSGNGGNGGIDAGNGNGGTTAGNGPTTGNGSDTDAGAGNGGNTGVEPRCDVAKLLAAKCATSGCHGSAASAAGLDLAGPNAGTRLRDKSASAACEDFLLVDTAAPEQSLIYLKVSKAQPDCGSRMPFGVPLTDDEQACILEWAQSL